METTANMVDHFNVDFQGIKEEHPKSNKKTIIVLSITISVAIALITTIFLIVYFKFNWFKDQYDIDIKIKNFANQSDYFREKKIIKSKVLYTSGDEDLDENQQNNEDLDNSKQLRNLDFDGSFSKSWNLATLNILEKEVSLTYEISLGGGILKNILSVSCGNVKYSLGNTGTSSNKQEVKNIGDKKLFSVNFPVIPVPVKFSFIAIGTIEYRVEYDASQKRYSISLQGTLFAKGELDQGVDGGEITVGAKGTIINIKANNILTQISSSFVTQNTIIISGGEITSYASGNIIGFENFEIINTDGKPWTKILN